MGLYRLIRAATESSAQMNLCLGEERRFIRRHSDRGPNILWVVVTIRGYIGIMEETMESTIMGYIGVV